MSSVELAEVKQVDISSLRSEEWYQNLIDNCKTIITEAVFTSRWALVEGYHQLGERISEENNNFERAKIYGEKIVKGLAKSLQTSERTLYYAIQFYDKYPELDELPEGKNITWNKVITKYLPEVKEEQAIETISLPEGQFNVILADCPWRYDFSKDNKDKVEVHYPTMTLEDIKRLVIPSADNAVLYLWATAPKLIEALEVMKAWGFTYKTNMTWDKEWIGMGYWFRNEHEHLLVGVKGKFSPPSAKLRKSSMLHERRTKHSKKPDVIREWINLWYPDKTKIELFARKPDNPLFEDKSWEGWDVWGNEVESDIEL